MLRNRALPLLLAVCSIVFHWGVGHAQTSSSAVTEDFTGATTTNQWYFFGDACLTAGTTAVIGNLGLPVGSNYSFEGCVVNTNYGESLVGGYNGTKSGSVAVSAIPSTALDQVGYGALRFTNGCINSSSGCSSSGGHNQNGAIISANAVPTSQGLDITFKTVTYRGDSGGSGSDGADGMSFFLMDGSVDLTTDPTEDIGSYGGSLGYTCSNQNNNETEPYHGMVGAYLGLGIDEYGNFLNGSSNNLNETDGSWSRADHMEDNTASGGLYKPNRIGLRGRGNIAWNWLMTNHPDDYPPGLSTSLQNEAVQYTCRTGYLWNFSPALTGGSPTETSTQVDDYLAIPDAYKVIKDKIANEFSSGGYSRRPPGSTTAKGDTGATPITYRLKITQDGLQTLAYSYDGGAWSNVIQNRQISDYNGTIPATVRFGFAGSTGGSSNIHEILCFKATPVTEAASSTTVNQQQSSRVENGSQAYFGYYDPTDWTGRLTANSLITDSSGNLSIASSANWDASCVLTGVTTCPTTGASGPATAQSWKNSDSGGRVILTWSGSAGIPLEWSSLSTPEKSTLDAGDSSQTEYRLDYLRGDRSNEVPTTGPSGNQIYRDRDSVLGDIVDSSSAWVGPPSKSIFSAYESPISWRDKLYPTATMGENSGESYTLYAQKKATRLNVVYVGSNDGMVHGFSAGSYDSGGTVYDSSTNTGQEVLAYMPMGVLDAIHNSSDSQSDYSNTQYGHNFFVDATPGTGDLYYSGNCPSGVPSPCWHTWLVGGLGPGGAEIYALDVTDPSSFSEGNASSLVIGDWTPTSITCTNPADNTTSSCKDGSGNSYLGNTYGTPQIRRLHNGDWAVLFGNGLGSASGDAGLFILAVSSTGTQTLYYLSTGVTGSNGIAYVTPVDMDGDHVVDYVYAGDLLGNVWRFDLTNSNPASWAVDGPIFKTASGQPITTAIQPDFVTGPIGSTTQLMLFFGSGEKFPLTNSTSTSYQTGTQNFYGVWDWDMTSWDAHSSSQFAKVSTSTVGTLTSLGSPYTLSTQNLQSQTVSIDSSTGDRFISSTNTVCWAGTSTCSGGSSANKAFGWYISFPGTNAAFSTNTYEQVVFNPIIVSTAVVFNSILPAVDSPLMCTPDKDKGWTYALDVRNGGPVPNFFVNPGTSTTTNNLATTTIGYEADASGTSSLVDTSNGSGGTNYFLIFQSTSGGPGTPVQIEPGANISSSRQTWIQLR